MKEKQINPPKILIVDDVSKNIQIVAEFLKPEGYRLAFAQSGKAALAHVESKQVDLILLDVMMPEMDGFEVCSQLKVSSKTRDIPIIFLTGKVETENIVRAFEIGAVDYVTKPFKKEELLARVYTHLELKRTREDMQFLYNQINAEIGIASEVQKNVMRTKVDVPFLTSALIFQPFEEVSGDMIDISTTGESELNIFLGDATGHGIPTALITMMIPNILDGKRKGEPTSEMMNKINISFSQRNIENHFLTGIYARITEEGLLSQCSAAHPPLIVIPVDGGPSVNLTTDGMAMGMFSVELTEPYEENEYILKPGDKFFLYTDGVTEWANPKKEQFGVDQLIHVLEENRSSDVDLILNTLMKKVKTFSKGVPCSDDYTIIGFEFLGKKSN